MGTKFLLVILMTILAIGLINGASARSCSDSDDGFDKYTQGYCSADYGSGTDKCDSNSDGWGDILEYDCMLDGPNQSHTRCMSFIAECGDGYVCDDGACVEEEGRGDDPEPDYEPEITSGCFGAIDCSSYRFNECPFQMGCSLHINYFPFRLSCQGYFDCSDYIEPRCKFSEDYGCEWIEPNNFI